MDYVWTPWRYRYIAGVKPEGCVFCDAPKAGDDAAMLIVLRGKKNFVILNRYPYTSGHVMVVPYGHEAALSAFDVETLSEMMLLARRVQTALEVTYRPEGYNLGMNMGRAAGAGIAGPSASALAAALDWRHEFYEHDCGNAPPGTRGTCRLRTQKLHHALIADARENRGTVPQSHP